MAHRVTMKSIAGCADVYWRTVRDYAVELLDMMQQDMVEKE